MPHPQPFRVNGITIVLVCIAPSFHNLYTLSYPPLTVKSLRLEHFILLIFITYILVFLVFIIHPFVLSVFIKYPFVQIKPYSNKRNDKGQALQKDSTLHISLIWIDLISFCISLATVIVFNRTKGNLIHFKFSFQYINTTQICRY